MPSSITIRRIYSTDSTYTQLLAFRNRLLRVPLGLNLYEESLAAESADIMLIAEASTTLCGCVMLHLLDKQTVQLRQMAIDTTLQGKGLGKQLLTAAENTAWESGYKKIILHARITARGFYERAGYQTRGAVFTEVTIPHIAMIKKLS